MTILTQKSLQEWKKNQFDNQNGICPICKRALPFWNASNGDHSHYSGHMRGLLHVGCNGFEGRIQTLFYRAGLSGADWPDVLRNLADYWEQDYSNNPIHPNHVNDMAKKFSRFNKEEMIKELRSAGAGADRTYSREQLVGIFKKTYREKLA